MNNHNLFIEKISSFHSLFIKLLEKFSEIQRDESTNIFITHDFNNVFKRYNDPIVKDAFNILKRDGRFHFNQKVLMSVNKAQFNIQLFGAKSGLPLGLKTNSITDYSNHYASDERCNYIFGIQPLGLSIFKYDDYHDGGLFDYVSDYESPFWFNEDLNRAHWLYDIFSAMINYQFDKNLQSFIKRYFNRDDQKAFEILEYNGISTDHKYAITHKYTVDKLIYQPQNLDEQGYPIFLSEKDFEKPIWLPKSITKAVGFSDIDFLFLNDVFRQTFIDVCDLFPKYIDDIVVFYQEIIQELKLVNENLNS